MNLQNISTLEVTILIALVGVVWRLATLINSSVTRLEFEDFRRTQDERYRRKQEESQQEHRHYIRAEDFQRSRESTESKLKKIEEDVEKKMDKIDSKLDAISSNHSNIEKAVEAINTKLSIYFERKT